MALYRRVRSLGFWSGSNGPQLSPAVKALAFFSPCRVDQIPELLRTVERLTASGFLLRGSLAGDERGETAVYFCLLPAERLTGKAVLVLPPLLAGAALVTGDWEGAGRFQSGFGERALSFLLHFLEPDSAFIFGCSAWCAFPLPYNEQEVLQHVDWDGLAHLIPSLLVAHSLLGLAVGKIPFSSTQEGVLSEASWYFYPQPSADNSQHPSGPFPSTTASFLLSVALHFIPSFLFLPLPTLTSLATQSCHGDT